MCSVVHVYTMASIYSHRSSLYPSRDWGEHRNRDRRFSERQPSVLPVISMAYPKLSAAIDELLSTMVKEQGEDLLEMAVAWCIASKEKPEIVAEKSVPIPVSTGEEAKL